MHVFAYDSKLSTFLRKISDYVIINGLLLIGCLPVLTVGAAITAVYYTILEHQIRGKGYLLPTFFRGFKQNMKQGVLIWSICLLFIVLFSYDIVYFGQRMQAGQMDGVLYILFTILLLLLILLTLYLFSYMARFEDNGRTVFRNAGIMMLSHPWQNIKLILLLLIFGLSIYLQPLFILILPVLYLRTAVDIFEKIFVRYMRKED